MNINVCDGRGIVTHTVQLYYDLGRKWVATFTYVNDAAARKRLANMEAEGPELQIAFDNLKAKAGL